jgi:hypothetical protein
MPYCLQNYFTILVFSALGSGIENIRPNDPSGVLARVVVATVKTEPQVAQLEYYKRGSDRPREVQLAMRVVKDSEATFWQCPPEHLGTSDEGIRFRHRGAIGLALRQTARRVCAWRGRL